MNSNEEAWPASWRASRRQTGGSVGSMRESAIPRSRGASGRATSVPEPADNSGHSGLLTGKPGSCRSWAPAVSDVARNDHLSSRSRSSRTSDQRTYLCRHASAPATPSPLDVYVSHLLAILNVRKPCSFPLLRASCQRKIDSSRKY